MALFMECTTSRVAWRCRRRRRAREGLETQNRYDATYLQYWVSEPTGRSTRHNPSGLTAREVEVLRLLAQGRQNREIAIDLLVSPTTVDRDLAAVYRKLGVSDRRAAARSAAALGIG